MLARNSAIGQKVAGTASRNIHRRRKLRRQSQQTEIVEQDIVVDAEAGANGRFAACARRIGNTDREA